MHPDETLRALTRAILSEDKELAVALWKDLKNWMNKGGAEPTWGSTMRRSQFFKEFNPETGMLDR